MIVRKQCEVNRHSQTSMKTLQFQSHLLSSREICSSPYLENPVLNTGNYISLYLTICETESENLFTGWEDTFNFRLFAYNHIHDTYFTIQILNY